MIVIPTGWTDKNRGKQSPEKFMISQFPTLMNYLKQFEAKAKNAMTRAIIGGNFVTASTILSLKRGRWCGKN